MARLAAGEHTCIADSAIYVANHGDGTTTLRNWSRDSQKAANLEITIDP